jgi:hypothetical protein
VWAGFGGQCADLFAAVDSLAWAKLSAPTDHAGRRKGADILWFDRADVIFQDIAHVEDADEPV